MAERLYLGPVSKQLRGNREDALTLKREARIKVGYLFDSMMPGQTFKTGSWSLGDGRRIMAFVWNDVLGKRATVRLTGVGGFELAPTLFFLETGWLAWNVAEVDWEWPLRIYTTAMERNYFNMASHFKAAAYEQDVWLPVNPALQVPGWWYESRNWTGVGGQVVPSASLDQPARYTGLARLWAQGCLAAGKTATSVLTAVGMYAGVNVTTNTGVLRFSSATEGLCWWLVNIASAGVTAVRMRVPEAFKSAVLHLQQGYFIDPLEASSVEAYVLGNMEFPDAPIEIKTEAEMDVVYQERSHDRWDFCDQRVGTVGQSQAKAIATITGGMYGTVPNKYWTSHLARMTAVTDNDDFLLMSFTTTDPVDWANGTTGPKLYTPYTFGGWIYVDEKDGVSENSAIGYGLDAPIMAFHEPDGSEFIILQATGAQEVVSDPVEPDWAELALCCGPGTKSGSFESNSSQQYGFIIPEMPEAQFVVRARNFTQNTYTATSGATYTSTPAFFIDPDDGFYYLQFGDDDCSGYQLIGPYTAEEANALQPMVHTPIGAGTNVVTVADQWSESVGLSLIIGYYPRTFGVVRSRSFTVTAAYTQTLTRLSDTLSSYQETIAGVTATLENDISVLTNPSSFPGDVQTDLIYTAFPDPEFEAVFRTEHGTLYNDTDPDLFTWISGSTITYSGYYSLSSYTGEEITVPTGAAHYPPGMDISTAAEVGAFIGGA